MQSNRSPKDDVTDYEYEIVNNEVTITEYVGNETVLNIPSEIKSKKVTRIEDSAFRSCSKLTKITIPSSVTSIGGYAFCGCSKLAQITIPGSVRSIGSSAFKNCSNLTKIAILNGVRSIGSSAFDGCSKLIQIAIPNSVRSIESSAFDGCNVTVYAPHGASYYGRTSYDGVKEWIVN